MTVVVLWFNPWFAGQEVGGSIPGLATRISDIGYLLRPRRDIDKRSLKRRKSSKHQRPNPLRNTYPDLYPTELHLNKANTSDKETFLP